jgi:hypothetical protein
MEGIEVLAHELIEFWFEGEVVATSGQKRRVCNSLHYQLSTQLEPFEIVRLLWDFAGFFLADKLLQLLPSSYYMVSFTGRYPALVPVVEETIPVGNPGLRPGDRLPTFTVAFIHLRSNFRGRFARGSKRFGPLSTLDVTGSSLTAEARAGWQSMADLCTSNWDLAPGGTNPALLFPIVWAQSQTRVVHAVTEYAGYSVERATVNTLVSSLRHRQERTITSA